MASARSPRRARWRLFGSAAGAAALVAAAWTAVPAQAEPHHAAAKHPSSVTLSAFATKVATTKGQKLSVSLEASVPTSHCSSSTEYLDVTLTDKSAKGDETHGWTLVMPCSAVKHHGRSATLKEPAKNISPLGAIKLAYHNRHGGKTKCETQTNKGSLAGTFTFKPGGAWGSLGSSHFTFHHAQLLYGYSSGSTKGCGTPQPSPRCPSKAYYAYNLSNNAGDESSTAYGSTLNSYFFGHLTGSRDDVMLGKPKGASRYDELIATNAPKPKVSTSGKHLKLTIKTGGGLATGSATLSGKNPSSFQYGCKGKGSGKKQTSEEDWSATVAKGATLTFHPAVGSSFRLKPFSPNHGYADVSRYDKP